jgi:hypothetical protein
LLPVSRQYGPTQQHGNLRGGRRNDDVETTLNSVEPESAAVTNAQVKEFNKHNGTDVKPGLTAVPFMEEQ